MEEVRTEIEESPLAISVDAIGYKPGEEMKPTNYNILMSTACRIVGELNEYGEPINAFIEYQDWFTPWKTLFCTPEDAEYLLKFAQFFYYGE